MFLAGFDQVQMQSAVDCTGRRLWRSSRGQAVSSPAWCSRVRRRRVEIAEYWPSKLRLEMLPCFSTPGARASPPEVSLTPG
jgi:hypothetical protein